MENNIYKFLGGFIPMPIKDFFDNLVKSLNTKEEGFSGRKLSAWGTTSTAIALGGSYIYGVVMEKVQFDWIGVALVAIYLFFTVIFLAIINGQQLTDIINNYNNNKKKTTE
jgi:hypothetical protein